MSSEAQIVQEKQFDAFSLHPIPANGRGHVAVSFTFEGRLRDLTTGDDSVEIVKINIGGTTVLAGMPWREQFEKERFEVARGRRMAVIVQNNSTTDRILRISVAVEPGAVSADAAVRTSQREVVKQHAALRRSPQRRPHGAVKKPIVKKITQDDLVLVTPGPNERAVLLLRGHAATLLRFFEHRVPMHAASKQSIIGQLDRSLGNEDAISVGGNEVVACIHHTTIPQMIKSVRSNTPLIDELSKAEMIERLHEAINRPTPLTPKAQLKASRMLPPTASPSSG